METLLWGRNSVNSSSLCFKFHRGENFSVYIRSLTQGLIPRRLSINTWKVAGGGAPTVPNHSSHLLVDFVFCMYVGWFPWHLHVGRRIPITGHMHRWKRKWEGPFILSPQGSAGLSGQPNDRFYPEFSSKLLLTRLTKLCNSLGLRYKQDWLVKGGLMKHTYNKKGVTAVEEEM